MSARPARVLADDRAYIGTADQFEIQVWSLEGELLRRVRRPVDARTMTEVDIERYVDFATRDAEEAEEQRRNVVDAENSPATFPAYEQFLLDGAGHLWVENYRTPWERGERRVWSVFDADGVWPGDVEVPSAFEITDIGDDHVLGIFRDELDQESVRLYRLLEDAG